MYIVKRTKTADVDGKKVTGTLYATKVAPDGKVAGWASDRDAAKPIDEALGLKVVEEYRDRPQAGKVEVLDLNAPAKADK